MEGCIVILDMRFKSSDDMEGCMVILDMSGLFSPFLKQCSTPPHLLEM